jgi:nitroreductase
MNDVARDFLELVRRRRTCREHGCASVPPLSLTRIFEAARWAPSAANRQPWEFVVIASTALKQQLRAAFLAEAHGRDPKYASVTENQADLLLAPGLVLVCGDPGVKRRFVNAEEIGEAVREELFLLTMGAAIQNMLLMAAACGLSSTWIARPARIARIRELLDIPPGIRTLAFIALSGSKPAESWKENMRQPIAEKVHVDRFVPS